MELADPSIDTVLKFSEVDSTIAQISFGEFYTSFVFTAFDRQQNKKIYATLIIETPNDDIITNQKLVFGTWTRINRSTYTFNTTNGIKCKLRDDVSDPSSQSSSSSD